MQVIISDLLVSSNEQRAKIALLKTQNDSLVNVLLF